MRRKQDPYSMFMAAASLFSKLRPARLLPRQWAIPFSTHLSDQAREIRLDVLDGEKKGGRT